MILILMMIACVLALCYLGLHALLGRAPISAARRHICRMRGHRHGAMGKAGPAHYISVCTMCRRGIVKVGRDGGWDIRS